MAAARFVVMLVRRGVRVARRHTDVGEDDDEGDEEQRDGGRT
jgi:hypothetical protein